MDFRQTLGCEPGNIASNGKVWQIGRAERVKTLGGRTWAAGSGKGLPAPAYGLRCYKADERRAVWLVGPPGQAWRVVKLWPLRPMLVFKLLVGWAQPQRQVRGTRRLSRAGIATPGVLRGPRAKRIGGRWVVTLEMAYVEGPSLIELLRDRTVARERRRGLARAAGELVAAMVRRGVTHHDLKPDNVVVDATASGDRLVVVDTADAGPARDAGAATAWMLDRLTAVEPVLWPTYTAELWLPATRAALRGVNRAERRRAIAAMRRQRRVRAR